MSYLFSIPSKFAELVALLLLITPIILSLLSYWISNRGSSSRFSKIISKFIITPAPLEPLHTEVTDAQDISLMKNIFKNQFIYRILLIYVFLILFLVGNLIGTFYFILNDVRLYVNQGSTGDIRIWTSIVLNSPFSGGWMGFLPWYGNFPLPLSNLDTFHDTWSWVFFTASITDNSAFLDTMAWAIFSSNIFSGFIFLSPLFLGVIRKSFLPSMFFFSTGMLITMKSLFSCFSQVFKLEFTSGSITYGIQTITKIDLLNVDLLMSFLLPLLLVMIGFYVFFALLGHRIWNYYYPDNHFSHKWFLLYITISFWGSLVILMV